MTKAEACSEKCGVECTEQPYNVCPGVDVAMSSSANMTSMDGASEDDSYDENGCYLSNIR